jgi:hypothetical protein
MKKFYSLAIASAVALSLAGCAGGTSGLSTAHTDKDKDGIVDINDQCPNTKAGVKVSADGCAIAMGVSPAEAAKMDEREVCSLSKLGVEKVLANAKVYNASAIKEGVEFRRLNVNNSALIASVEEALKTGAKMVNPDHFKSKPNKVKKSKTKLKTDYAAWRACAFGLSALQQKHEAKSTWRQAVPGDQYKY